MKTNSSTIRSISLFNEHQPSAPSLGDCSAGSSAFNHLTRCGPHSNHWQFTFGPHSKTITSLSSASFLRIKIFLRILFYCEKTNRDLKILYLISFSAQKFACIPEKILHIAKAPPILERSQIFYHTGESHWFSINFFIYFWQNYWSSSHYFCASFIYFLASIKNLLFSEDFLIWDKDLLEVRVESLGGFFKFSPKSIHHRLVLKFLNYFRNSSFFSIYTEFLNVC